MLQPLGISAEAEAVYVVLAPLKGATKRHLADLMALDVAQVAASLDELRQLGLATELSAGHWEALPLPEVVKALKVQRLSELELATFAADSLHSHLMAAAHSQSDDIRIFVGREAITAMMRELCSSAKSEICMFDKPPYAEDRDATEEALNEVAPEWQALERGIHLRTVYHPGFDDDRLLELTLFAENGEDARTAPVPMKLVLVDSRTALIPSMQSYEPGHELRMSLVRHPLLVEALQWLFEAVWDASVPIVSASTAGERDPRRQMLISLMMTGSTDTAIANTLGINVRSVRRWIAELMDELRVTTRLQLGAALVRAEYARSRPNDRPTPVVVDQASMYRNTA